ncbi:hypothetical protein BFW01_g11130 [Lasiodiplodia theobromae]|nr:hypothetical protein BFW01_g11130 [Lasiodiplodia theobromae]
MLATRKHPILFAAVLFALSIFFYHQTVIAPILHWTPDRPTAGHFDWNGPANATLGFNAIIVVSGPGSPRRSRLIQASNVTEIDLTIPDQPQWTEQDIKNFTDALAWGGRETGRGSTLAWLSHHHVLQWFLHSELETALILEDDVDWDIRLRTLQIPHAAAAVRDLLQPATTYYGDLGSWDLLWIGHCGDWFNKIEAGIGPGYQKPEDLRSLPHRIFNDSTLPDRENLHPFTKDFLTAIEMPEKARAFHKALHPLCTFGYAVTRHGAARIVKDIAPITRPESPAYDTAMLHGCVKRGLRCYTVNPELFHHMIGDSIIAQEDQREIVYLPPVDEKGLEQCKQRKETSNIDCGFWSEDFLFDSEERLQMLREDVGRQGKCLKPGRDVAVAPQPKHSAA